MAPPIPEGEPPEGRYRMAMVNRCANQACSNRAGEGTMAVLTAHTTRPVATRDVTLILCAPCAEYLARMLR